MSGRVRERLARVVLVAVAAVAAVGAGLAGGCATRTEPVEIALAPGAYPLAFDAAREVLRDARFQLERVDGRAGVVATRAKTTGGLLTPWDGEQATLRDEVDDAMNRQQRRVRVTFHRVGADGVVESEPPLDVDLRADPGPMVMRVRAVVERVHEPGWRVETSSINLSTSASDPALYRRGMQPSYAVAEREDARLSNRLADRMTRALAGRVGGPDVPPVEPAPADAAVEQAAPVDAGG